MHIDECTIREEILKSLTCFPRLNIQRYRNFKIPFVAR
jgi:hypothetical protein